MWDMERRRNQYQGSAHGDAKTIIIRWADLSEEDDPIAASFRSLNIIDQPMAEQLMPEVGDAVMAVLEAVSPVVRLGRVMLTKLPPGGKIDPHVDEGIYADHHSRFHLCLQGDKGNTFVCGKETYHPENGAAFWFNHKRQHSVSNQGSIERIHLIVDAVTPRFTKLRGVYYQAENGSDIWDEVAPLLARHWEEVAHYQDIPLEPDREVYEGLEARGQLRCFTARDCGQLAGYAVFLVRPNMHYKSSLQAVQDVLFLAPEYRRGRVGISLLQFSEQRLAAEGVQAVYHHVKRTTQVGRLLGRLGYELIDEVYGKRLDLGE